MTSRGAASEHQAGRRRPVKSNEEERYSDDDDEDYDDEYNYHSDDDGYYYDSEEEDHLAFYMCVHPPSCALRLNRAGSCSRSSCAAGVGAPPRGVRAAALPRHPR